MDIDEDKGGLVEEGEFKSYCKRKGTFGILSLLRGAVFRVQNDDLIQYMSHCFNHFHGDGARFRFRFLSYQNVVHAAN